VTVNSKGAQQDATCISVRLGCLVRPFVAIDSQDRTPNHESGPALPGPEPFETESLAAESARGAAS
jgi:hypothetical protein